MLLVVVDTERGWLNLPIRPCTYYCPTVTSIEQHLILKSRHICLGIANDEPRLEMAYLCDSNSILFGTGSVLEESKIYLLILGFVNGYPYEVDFILHEGERENSHQGQRWEAEGILHVTYRERVWG